ncbi:MAG: protein translocase subunit SecF [Alphaproteobacteria bacterium]|nr:protein translocase subunit SecF [Alphaproteobacteria bacterium]
MRHLRMIPDGTKIPFMGTHRIWMAVSLLLCAAAIVLMFTKTLNFGVDFTGGILMEVDTGKPADLEAMRGTLGGLGVGTVALQGFSSASAVLIRLPQQEGGEAAQNEAILKVRASLAEQYGEGVSYRRVELVGPKVGAELIQDGIIAVVVAIVLMLVYVWFRFELPFGVGAVVAILHDVLFTLGIYALSGFEFSLSTVAAVLLIIGYSMNDTVVVYDRVRENLRKYKSMALPDLIDRSVNETLARTIVTSVTALLALGALLAFGGDVIRDFAFAMFIGVIVGTYSSIFVASASLLYIRPNRKAGEKKAVGPVSEYDEIEQRHREQAEEFAPTEAFDEPPEEPSPSSPSGAQRKRASSSRSRRRRRDR